MEFTGVTPRIFISYSHNDKAWKDRVVSQLGVLEHEGLLSVWDDRRIAAGQDWLPEIETAIDSCNVALLLISAKFLNSKFILGKEVPALLQRREQAGVRIIPVILKPCAWRLVSWLKTIQARPKDGRPLSGMIKPKGDAALATLAEEIADLLAQAPPSTKSTKVDLTKLPAGAADFLGREAELKLLDDAWADTGHTQVVELVAPGGVGKTALVKRWLDHLKTDGWRGAQRVYGWSFFSQGTSEDRQASDDTFLSEALRWFAVEHDPAISPWDKGKRLAKAVAASRTLLVLDGVEPLQYPPGPMTGQLRTPGLKALLTQLVSSGQPGLCLLTTRERIQDLAEYERSADHPTGAVIRYDLGNLSESDGARLLHKLGVRHTGAIFIPPDDAELKQASREVHGHALTISLLGNYLAKAYAGDIRQRDKVEFDQADEETRAGYTFKVMAAYEKWFQREGEQGARELAALRLFGFFDRPADPGCLAALRQAPPIPGLTEPLVNLNTAQWNIILNRLKASSLIELTQPDSQSIEANPLVREYLAKSLREHQPDAWREGHRRIYEHLRASAPYRKVMADYETWFQREGERGAREMAALRYLLDKLTDPASEEKIRLYAAQANDASALIHTLLRAGTDASLKLAFTCIKDDANIALELRQLVQLGNEAIRRYFAEERRSGIFTLREAKLLLVGQGKVGKTTLRRKLEDPRAPMPTPGDTTRGIEITCLNERVLETGEPLRINVWDFGGQDIQHYIHQFFLTGSSLYALVTNERIQDSVHLPYWLNIIETLGNKSPVILIQNKEGGHCQPLPDEAAIRARFGNVHNRVFQVDFSQAVTEPEFAELRREIIHQAALLPHVEQKYPASFFDLRSKLEAKADQGIDYLRWTDYCALMPELLEDVMRQYANVLTSLGVCQYFQNDVFLSNYVFLRPKWIIDALFALLLHPSLETTCGHFTENDTLRIWQGKEYQGIHALLVRMMRRFDFCYQIEGEEDSYILPQRLPRLPKESQTYGWNELSDTPIQYKYKFMPKGILIRLICRLHQRIERHPVRGQRVWSDAVIFALPDGKGRVFAREIYSENTIELRAAGDKREEMLNEVIRTIDDINDKYEKLPIDKLVPCPCPECLAAGEKRFFHKFNVLMKSLDKGHTTSRCENSIDDIKIAEILGKSGVKRTAIRSRESAMTTTPLRIFISYSHIDHEYFSVFKNDFIAYAKIPGLFIEVFSDDGIPIGEDWDKYLQSKVADCDVMVLLVSKHFMNSHYIHEKEFGAAMERLKKEQKLLIFPIYFAPCQFESDEELAHLQFFKPHGQDFGEARKGNEFSYADLVRFNRDDSLPIPNANLQHYMKALIEKLEPELRKLSGGIY